jgi:hypothetical protein
VAGEHSTTEPTMLIYNNDCEGLKYTMRQDS